MYSDIYTLSFTRLSILKMISSKFLLVCIHSYEIVHFWSTFMKNHSIIVVFLHTCLQPMGTIIMIWYTINFQIICDSFLLPIFNNSIFLIVILVIRGIVVVWLNNIVLLVNVWSVITVTSILNLVLFIHIYSWSYGRSIYIWHVTELGDKNFYVI